MSSTERKMFGRQCTGHGRNIKTSWIVEDAVHKLQQNQKNSLLRPCAYIRPLVIQVFYFLLQSIIMSIKVVGLTTTPINEQTLTSIMGGWMRLIRSTGLMRGPHGCKGRYREDNVCYGRGTKRNLLVKSLNATRGTSSGCTT